MVRGCFGVFLALGGMRAISLSVSVGDRLRVSAIIVLVDFFVFVVVYFVFVVLFG